MVFAQLRQFFLDSRRQIELQERYEQGRPGTRPPFDAQLAAGAEIVAGKLPLLCEANESDDVERWLRLSDEFGLKPNIVGGLEAWRVKDVLTQRGMTVVLTLDWGKEVKDPRPKKDKEKKRRRRSKPRRRSRAGRAARGRGREAGRGDGDEPGKSGSTRALCRPARRRTRLVGGGPRLPRPGRAAGVASVRHRERSRRSCSTRVRSLRTVCPRTRP
jgi:hypothetical protein